MPLEDQLFNSGWPMALESEIDVVESRKFEYLGDVKHSIRIAYDKSKSGGKKGKKKGKGKGAAEPEPEKVIENCVIFVGHEYPEFQRKTLEVLQKYDANEAGELQGDYMTEVRQTIKGKEGGIACKFAAFIVEQVQSIGKEAAMSLSMPWDEVEFLEANKSFTFENMGQIKNIQIMKNNDPKAESIEGSQQTRDAAVPGKPAAIFF
jgi:hypothetical protein